MKKLVTVALAVGLTFSTFGYWNTVYWQAATEEGVISYSGSFTNAAHWNVARVPGQDPAKADGAFFNCHDVGAYTVTFPVGAFTNSAGVEVDVKQGDDLTLSGLGTQLTVTNAPWGTYGFRCYSQDSGTVPFFALIDTGAAPAGRTVLAATNFLCRIAQTNASEVVADVTSGDWSFVSSGALHFFGMENGSASSSQLNFWTRFGVGTSLSCANAYHDGRAGLTNRLTFAGADVRMASLTLNNGGSTSLANELEFTDGATLDVSGAVTLGSATRTHNRYLFENSRLNVGSTFEMSTGGTADFFMSHCVWTNAAAVKFQSAGDVRIADSSLSTSNSLYFVGCRAVLTNVYYQIFKEACGVYVSGSADVDFQGLALPRCPESPVSRIYQVVVGDAASAAVPRLRLHDVDMVAGKTHSFVGRGSSGCFGLYGSSSFKGSGASTYLGGDAGDKADLNAVACTGRVDLAGNAIFAAGSYFGIGSRAGCYGIVNVHDNAQATPLAAEEPARVYIGRYGSGELNLHGGSLHAGKYIRYNENISLGKMVSPNETGVSSLNQYGGVIGSERMTTVGIVASEAAGRKSRVRLDGGVTKVPFVRGGAGSGAYPTPGTGYAGFFANGGRLEATVADGTFLAYFDEAKLGAKGLTLASEFAVTVPQDFGDQEGAEGQGRLTLVGSGTKTLAGKMPSVVEAAEGGSVVFAAGATLPKTLIVTNGVEVSFEGAATLENLTLGDETSVGVLRLKRGNALTVTGDLDIANLQIVLDGSFVAGEDIDLFTCPNGVSAETEAKFVEAFARAGLADGTSCRFEKVSGEGASATLRVKVVAASPLVIRVDEGDETHVTNVLYNASEKLQTIVAEGASLTLEGKVGYGALEKTGEGTLKLSNEENAFYPGLKLLEGVLAVDDPLTLGKEGAQNVESARLGGGVLRTEGELPLVFPRNLKVEGGTATTLATVEATVETAMPPMTASQGNLMKKGAAPLVFSCAGEQTMPLSKTGTATDQFRSFGLHSGFTVFEGETVFRGEGESAKLTMQSNVAVGIPEEEPLGAQPGLVVDNMTLDLGTQSLYMAPSCTNDKDRVFAGYVTDPYVIVTNGGILKVTGYAPLSDTHGAYSRQFGRCRTVLDGGELRVTGTLNGSAANTGGGWAGWQIAHSMYEIRNGGAIRAANFSTANSIGVDADHGTIAGYSATGDLVPVVLAFQSGECTSRWDLVSSEFCVSKIWRSTSNANGPHNIRFEDTRWSCGDADLVIGSANVVIDFQVAGRGLKVAPYEGRTYSVTRPLTGSGGIVMDGPGTLRFCPATLKGVAEADPVTPKYAGATEVNGGTIDFGGFSLTNMAFIGAGGRIENATLVNATIANTNLTFAADVAFRGRTRVDFGNLDVADGDVVTVGHYEGTEPDVTLWRCRNFKTRGMKATLAAEGGDIVATVKVPGLMLIVR